MQTDQFGKLGQLTVKIKIALHACAPGHAIEQVLYAHP